MKERKKRGKEKEKKEKGKKWQRCSAYLDSPWVGKLGRLNARLVSIVRPSLKKSIHQSINKYGIMAFWTCSGTEYLPTCKRSWVQSLACTL